MYSSVNLLFQKSEFPKVLGLPVTPLVNVSH